MVSAKDLGIINQCLQIATQDYNKYFGGIHFLFLGDFYQLPPVQNISIYEKEIKNKNMNIKIKQLTEIGLDVYKSITTFIELTKNFRCKDKNYLDFLQRLRTGTTEINDENIFEIQKSLNDPKIKEFPQNTLHVSSTHKIVNEINDLSLKNLILNTNQTKVYIYSQHYRSKKIKINDENEEYISSLTSVIKNKLLTKDEIQKIYINDNTKINNETKNKYNLKFCLELTIGSRVSLIKNIDPSIGLFNGTTGTVVGFYYINEEYKDAQLPIFSKGKFNINKIDYNDITEENMQIPIVLIQIDEEWYQNESFEYKTKNIIPILPIIQNYVKDNIHYSRIQLPIIPSTCITIHRCQGNYIYYLLFIYYN